MRWAASSSRTDDLAEVSQAPDGVAPPHRGTGRQSLDVAILRTLAYADIFDYPLTLAEVQRYLVGRPASLATVEQHLSDPRLNVHLESVPPFWFLSGRAQVVDVRRQREAYSQALWPAARSYGRLIAAMPFVRMVAVSGALAMNNVSGPHDDVDLLVVARRGRVWLARALTIAVVHLARRWGGIELCPNYVLAETCLQLGQKGLYAAHEMAQLVPLHGQGTYQRFWESNRWIVAYLPNSVPRGLAGWEGRRSVQMGQQGLELLLGGRLGDALERWESARKIVRLRAVARARGGHGTDFQPDRCKGQMVDHATWTHERYTRRLQSLGLEPEPAL
jgi:hypothetical protein